MEDADLDNLLGYDTPQKPAPAAVASPTPAPVSQGDVDLDNLLGYKPDSKNTDTKNPGFFDRFAKDMEVRQQQKNEIMSRFKTQDPLSTAYQTFGKLGMGSIGDVAKEAGTSLLNGAKDIYDAVEPESEKENDAKTFARIGNSGVGKFASGAIQKGSQMYGEFEKAHPEAAGNIDATADILGGVPAYKGLTGVAGTIGKAAKGITSGTGNLVKTAFTDPYKQIDNFWANRATPEQAAHIAGMHYDYMDQVGGALTASKKNQIFDAAHAAVRGLTEEGKAVPPSSLAESILNNLDETRGRPLTLRGAQDLEQRINSKITYQQNGMLTPESVELLKIKKALRNGIDNAQPGDLIGGTSAWDAWNDAKKAHSARAILTDLSNIANKAAHTDQPASTLKKGLARWSSKTANVAGLEDNEMDLVKESIKNNFAHEILRSGSSRLVPIGALALGIDHGSGLLGGMLGTASSTGMRGIGFANQLSKMGDIADAVGERLPNMRTVRYPHSFNAAQPAPPPSGLGYTTKALPATPSAMRVTPGGQVFRETPEQAIAARGDREFLSQNHEMSVDHSGNATAATPEQIKMSMAQRAWRKQMGLTPDVAGAGQKYVQAQGHTAAEMAAAKAKEAQVDAMFKLHMSQPMPIRKAIFDHIATAQSIAAAKGETFTLSDMQLAMKNAIEGRFTGGAVY